MDKKKKTTSSEMYDGLDSWRDEQRVYEGGSEEDATAEAIRRYIERQRKREEKEQKDNGRDR